MTDSTNPLLTVIPQTRVEIMFEQNQSSSSYVTIKNNSQMECVAYKVKLTDPQGFLVKPCIGVLMSNNSV